MRRVDGLLDKGRRRSAGRGIELFPDVALQALRQATCQGATDPALLWVAEVYERQCCRVAPTKGWSAVLRDRAAHPARYDPYDAARRRLVAHVRSKRFADAAAGAIEAPADAPGRAIVLDADQLRGESLLLAGRPHEAAAEFERALPLARTTHPHQATQLLLLLCQARRGAGDAHAAGEAWRESVTLAAPLLAAARPVRDPVFWGLAADLKPKDEPWPPEVAQRFGPPGRTDARVWGQIGSWRLRRREARAALAAFERGEALAADPAARDRMRLGRAKAFVQLGQLDAASALLRRLAKSRTPEVARPALALMGTVHVQRKDPRSGIRALRRALADAAPDWPGRGQAEADLGLAYLLTGNETEGLTWLRSAQRRFEETGDFDMLASCLQSEAKFLDHVGKHREAREAVARLHELEAAPWAGGPAAAAGERLH